METKKFRIKNLELRIVLLFIAIACASCSLQKRHYTNGFYVGNKPLAKNNAKQVYTDTLPAVLSLLKPIKEKKNAPTLLANTKANPELIKHFLIDGCDTLILKDGTVILTSIKEVYPNEIKYKYCDDADGPLRTINKADAKSIIYSNGLKEEIVSEPALATYPVETQNNNERDYYAKKRNRSKKNPFILPGLIPNFATYPIAASLLVGYKTYLSNYSYYSYYPYYHQSLSSYINNSLGGRSIFPTSGGSSSPSALLIIGLLFSGAALAFSCIAIYQILTNKDGNKKGLGFAIAGAILSLLMLLFIVTVILGLI